MRIQHLLNTLHLLSLKVVIVKDSKAIIFAMNCKERTVLRDQAGISWNENHLKFTIEAVRFFP